MASPYTYAGPKWTDLAWRDPAGMRKGEKSTVSDSMATRERTAAAPVGRSSSVPGLPTSPGSDAPDQQVQKMVPKVPGGMQNGLMVSRSGPVGAAREAAPTVGGVQATAGAIPGVSGRLHGLLQSDSPYIDRARTRARQYANRRGLMNSSIAAGAGEAAAIDAALPIAQADANIAAGERAMRSQEFQQYRSIRSQELMQQKGLDHDAAQREADRELSELLQARDHRVQQLMQIERLDHDAAQQLANRELQSTLQRRGFAFQGEQNAFDRLHQRTMREGSQDFAAEQASLDREASRLAQERGLSFEAARQAAALTHATAEAERSREVQQQIASQSVVQSINAENQRWTTALALQTDLPQEVRQQYQDRLDFIRDESLSAAKKINEYVPSWTSGRRPDEQAPLRRTRR